MMAWKKNEHSYNGIMTDRFLLGNYFSKYPLFLWGRLFFPHSNPGSNPFCSVFGEDYLFLFRTSGSNNSFWSKSACRIGARAWWLKESENEIINRLKRLIL
jgi:hypothetical protein